MTSAKKRTLLLSMVNGLVRAMGFGMRILLSRLLGAEILGIGELASGIHMLAITPLTSGLPLAISRMTARAEEENRQKPLLAGLWLARTISAVLVPALLLFSPWLARLMGDERVLPCLWFTAPCVLILGYSAALNGYFYGMEQSLIPAASELIEQICRVFFSLLLVWLLRPLTAPWLAALPVACTMAAETIGLVFALRYLPPLQPGRQVSTRWKRAVFRLAAPATVTRMIQTGLRSLTAILIPMRLQVSGLPASEATARLGMLNGMVMPVLLLPGIFTSALAMVSMPRLAKAEEDRSALKRLLLCCMGACAAVGAVCSLAVWAAAPLLSLRIFRQAELTQLFRLCAPLTALLAISHFSGSVLNALGQQKRAMVGATASAALSLGLTWALAALPQLRLQGVALAQYAAHLLTVLWNFGVLIRFMHDDKSGPARPSRGRPGDIPPKAASIKGKALRFS